MSTLAFLLLTVGAAHAEAPSRTLCDGFEVAAQRACIEQNYPVIHAKVEETCRARPQGERRTCRTQAYAERGIHYGSTRAPSVGGIAPQTDTATGAPGTGTGTAGSAAVTPDANRGAAADTAKTAATDAPQSGTTGGGFGSKNTQTDGTSDSGGFGSKNAQADDGSRDGGDASRNNGGSQRMKALDPTTVTIATVALQTAGYTLQNVPTICQTLGCKMSKKQQKKLARWGTVIVSDVARVPKILGRKESDAAKITRLLKVTQAIADKAPTGLSGQAKGYVDMALGALQTLVAAFGR